MNTPATTPKRRRKAGKPTVLEKLRANLALANEANRLLFAQEAKLQAQIADLQRQADSNARIAVERGDELAQIHAILDHAPGAPAIFRRLGSTKSPNDNAAVRLGGWIANLHSRSVAR